jgi:2,3-bisphosphoglycerate-dependent phosphoglycerate mutase
MRRGLVQALAGKSGRRVLVVGHGGIFTFTMKNLCPGMDLSRLNYKGSQNCSITELSAEASQEQIVARLVRWWDASHLSGEAARFVSPTP